MPERVLIVQSDHKAAKSLGDFFARRGDEVRRATSLAAARQVLNAEVIDLVLMDLHLPGERYTQLLDILHNLYPDTKILITNRYPDLRRELIAKEYGVTVFLRAPFSPTWIENALERLAKGTQAVQSKLPKVQMPMRMKITFPYALLALLFVFAAAYLVSRYILVSTSTRFTNALIGNGKLAADWMVQEESRLLETLRLTTNAERFADIVKGGTSEELRDAILPIAVNYQIEAIHVIDPIGNSLLSMFHESGSTLEQYQDTRGETGFNNLDFVQKILTMQTDLRGDKFAGLIRSEQGDYFYVDGPVFSNDGEFVGVVLVGESLGTLVRQISRYTSENVSLYQLDGQPLASTLIVQSDLPILSSDLAQQTLEQQDVGSNIRKLKVENVNYSEILGAWEARGDDLGILGVSAHNQAESPSLAMRIQAFAVVALAFLGIIGLGLFLASQITRPLAKVVRASAEVAQGNLEVKVPSQGNDEVAVVASAFNYMVSGLQEGLIYRELLGRTVSPEVRETLRQSFESGKLRMDGQSAVATVLMSDIRDFTRLSEKADPTTILNWLNEYFGEMVPIVTAHGGVVDKFEGDAMLAYFGILPTPLPPQESARQACLAAVQILDVIERINQRRQERSEPPLLTGVGINTGTLTFGGLGTADRLNYTIIGDIVNTTQRIQTLTRDFGENGVIVGESTFSALGDLRVGFHFEPLGEHTLRGKEELLWLYRLRKENNQGTGGGSR